MKIDIEAHISVQIGAQKCDYNIGKGAGAALKNILSFMQIYYCMQ